MKINPITNLTVTSKYNKNVNIKYVQSKPSFKGSYVGDVVQVTNEIKKEEGIGWKAALELLVS